MTTSLKLDKTSKKVNGEYSLYVRIRGKNSNGRYCEASIYTGVSLSEKYFKNGGLSPRIPDYTNKQRIINRILDDLQRIISESIENGLEPNPKYVRSKFEERKKQKELKTPQIQSFWKSFDEYLATKKNTSYGYRKTISTLVNHLKDFEECRKQRISFEYVVLKTIVFQSEFNDFMWNQKNCSNSYLNKLYDNLSGFLYFSHQMGYINRKPKLKLESTIEKDEKVYLRTDEVIKLFNSKKWDYSEDKESELLNNPHIIILNQSFEETRSKRLGGVSKITNWELVKDIFLLQNSIGCRIGDIPRFKVSNVNFDSKNHVISWLQQKTHKKVSVPLNDIGGFIFRKYSAGKSPSQLLFPKISQQKFNKQLKLLLKDLGFNRMISRPRLIGSKMVDSEEKPLWKLISSHSGRRGFVKNSIDMGNMDYQTIMKLSGHKTFSEFSKYISVTTTDTLKVRGLYQMEEKSKVDMFNQLKAEFSKLNEDQKRMILGLIQGLNTSSI